jgi:hypothetical protein
VRHPGLGDIAGFYQRDIVRPGKEEAFWVLVAFIATFLVTRGITTWVRRSDASVHGLRIRDIHVHHLVWGILLVLVCGYLAIAHGVRTDWLAVLFGVGAALTLDEFALWLHLEDVYWSERGRHSVNVVIVCVATTALALVGLDFFAHLASVAWHAVGG